MALLNRIQQKLALLKVSSTLFVHPLAEAKEELCAALNTKAVHAFEVLGVKYLISDIVAESFPLCGTDRTYKVAIREGNMLLIGTVDLFSWEWLYLVKGFEAVNEAQYMKDIKNRSKDNPYLSSAEVEEEVKRWTDIASQEPESASMPEYIRSSYEAVTMDENGEWHNA